MILSQSEQAAEPSLVSHRFNKRPFVPKPQDGKYRVKDVFQYSKDRTNHWPWEARLVHLGSYVAATKVVGPAMERARNHGHAGMKERGEVESIADRRLLDERGSMAEKGSIAGTEAEDHDS